MRTIPSGFQPVPSLDAFPVACGNAGEVKLIAKDGTVTDLGQLGASAAGWNNRELALSRGVVIAPGVYGRQLVWLNIDTGVERDAGYDVTQQCGYFPQIACKSGRVVSSIEGQHFLDGQPVVTEQNAGKIEDFDGVHILFPVFANGQYTFVVRNIVTGVDVMRVPEHLSNARIDLLSDGPWLSWNEGWMQIMDPFGSEFTGPDGEGRGLLFEHEGVRYVATITTEGWTPIWIIRTFAGFVSGDGPAWRLEVGFDGMQYVNGFAMGFVQNVGTLTITPVPFGTPMTPYVKPVEPPEPVPMPAIITGLTIPRPTEPLPACWFGGWAGKHGPNVPGTMQCHRYPMSDWRPTMDQISRWPLPLDVPLLCGYLGSDDGADYTDQEIAAVKARPDGRAIYIHIDNDQRDYSRMLEVRRRVIDAGLVAILGGHNPPYEAPWGITRSYHFGWDGRRYVREPADVAARQAQLTELRRAMPGCVLDVIFGWDRPGGRLQCDELANYASELAYATPRPARLIGEPEPIVIVQPPVVVKPRSWFGWIESSTPKKPSILSKLAKWLKGRFK